MKTILVDAINAFIIKNEGVFQDMHELLEKYLNKKIILTGANDEEMDKFNLHNLPYELFTLKHNPEKTDPQYYRIMLKKYNLEPSDVIYFEHNIDAVKSAESVGIKTLHYDKNKKDLNELKNFLDENLKKEEKNIEVDKNDNKIGLRPRDDFYTGKYIHRASHLILFNLKNEILLQKRAKDKKWYPDLYTFSVDETVADESYEDCIKRGMQEEIGILIEVKRLFKYPFFDTFDKAWHCVFVGKSDQEIKPDKREIQKIKWIKVEELKKDVEKHPEIYTPPFTRGIKKYFSEFF